MKTIEKLMKINENQWKLMKNYWKSMKTNKINENQWKSLKTNEHLINLFINVINVRMFLGLKETWLHIRKLYAQDWNQNIP